MTSSPITVNQRRLLGLLVGLFALVAFGTIPILPVTTRIEYQVIVPVEGSPIQVRRFNETIPLSSATFQIQRLDIAFDQTIDISWQGTEPVDLIALLSNSATDGFVQSVMLDVGVPLGPSLFTGKDVSKLVAGLLEEKLPEIMRKSAESGYYRIDEVEDSTKLPLTAGSYNFVLLSLGDMGSLRVTIAYKSMETRTEIRFREDVTRISILEYLTKYLFNESK